VLAEEFDGVEGIERAYLHSAKMGNLPDAPPGSGRVS
jgi:hypothetical protein